MGRKGTWQGVDAEIRAALNEASRFLSFLTDFLKLKFNRLAIVDLVKSRELNTQDMPTTLASTFKLDSSVKLK